VLHVTDVNDNAPAFDRHLYQPEPLPEVALPGSFVVRVTAQDPDQGANGQVTYSLAPGTHARWFSIDPTSGIITTAASLDYELEPQPQLIVVATDGGLPPLSSSATVSVALQDVNDNEPQFQRTFYNASLPEGTQPGTCFLQVSRLCTQCCGRGGSEGHSGPQNKDQTLQVHLLVVIYAIWLDPIL
jgi:protocadherin-16/23